MVPFVNRTCDVLSAPNIVYYRERTASYLFYKLGVPTGKFANTYMVVVVSYNESGEGQVKTMYPTTRPTDDELRYGPVPIGRQQ
jgi:hypothetical protein